MQQLWWNCHKQSYDKYIGCIIEVTLNVHRYMLVEVSSSHTMMLWFQNNMHT
jgi:hypothetical protein